VHLFVERIDVWTLLGILPYKPHVYATDKHYKESIKIQETRPNPYQVSLPGKRIPTSADE
jgi:hypothetical protein